ncbi:hypothetical protein [Psychroflexus aestuariivivens]|uniref:hypothetical protein n=1 Tax=Psychroflexus aestuariivivens TaxID=1795040 RepID=UPI000FD92C21|nr:hypothetical protein [Psychroflexus aestuariivivens]
MTKSQRIKHIKKELSDLDVHEEIFKQSLSATTNRKKYLRQELEELGASSSSRKGKQESVLDMKQKAKLIASLTQ